ncbi:MAG: hypothetical protein A4E50_01203 [Methanosaeta sp. PtaB.Bin087]|nr:MAG: hypothetical protein A4E50_01203 [Methanosaeta sp. PtaB.Bin087]
MRSDLSIPIGMSAVAVISVKNRWKIEKNGLKRLGTGFLPPFKLKRST